jgi:hypothetical protein
MAGALMLMLFFVGFLLTLIFVFIILQSRSGTSFLPLRDYSYYIARSSVLSIKTEHEVSDVPMGAVSLK